MGKDLSEMTDTELIAHTLSLCRNELVDFLPCVIVYICGQEGEFREMLSGKRLFDIGSSGAWDDILIGEQPLDNLPLLEMYGNRSLNLGITELTYVDPFNTTITRRAFEGTQRLKASEKDGLGFLLEQPEGSGNVFTCGLDRRIIPVDEYRKRVVREIFRVVPEGGIYLTYASGDLAGYARERFPSCTHIGTGDLLVFHKD